MQDHSRSALSAERPFWISRRDHDEAQVLTSNNLSYGDLSVGRYRRDCVASQDAMTSNDKEPMFMAVVMMRPLPAHVILRDGRSLDVPAMEMGSLSVLDLRHVWTSLNPQPFDSVHAFITQSALDEVASDLGRPRIERLNCPCTVNHIDLTMLGLAQSLAPLLERPIEGNRLFADHIFAAILYYLASTYGKLNLGSTAPKALRRLGRLTLSQEKNVVARLLTDFNDVPGVAELASMCDLSRSHFVRAFKQTMGLPPHRWLLLQRIKQARLLLQDSNMQVSEVALECGFADQSHLTRVFTKAVGVSPGAWRRQRRD